MIIERFDGKVPKTLEELESFPSVGHKTASVVISQAFGIPAFPVDTHIHRLMYRWGLTNGKSVQNTEKDAQRLFPYSYGISYTFRLFIMVGNFLLLGDGISTMILLLLKLEENQL